MLIFFDETQRVGVSGHPLGALCGIAIPEEIFGKVISDVFSMKAASFGETFAKERELKGKKLLKAKNFRKERVKGGCCEIEFVRDLLRYIVKNKFTFFGVVSFDSTFNTFKCPDPLKLDPTYRILFDRIDSYMKLAFAGKRAKIIFDDTDYGMNESRATSITNFFNRSAVGRGFDSIIRTPFFSVSQAQSTGVQLADVVTTVCGMRFQGDPNVAPLWAILKKAIAIFEVGGRKFSTLKVFKSE